MVHREEEKCVQYRVRAMGVEAWQNWVGPTVRIGNKEINEKTKK